MILFQGLYHIGIYTTDIERSLSFYTQMLDFNLKWRGMVDHPAMGKIKVALVEQQNCTIELVQPNDAALVNEKAGPIQHLALKVESIDKVMERWKSKKITEFPLGEIEDLPSFGKGIRHTFIYGPSHERIELVEEYT